MGVKTKARGARKKEQETTLELDSFLPYLVVNLGKRLSSGLASTYQQDYELSVHQWRVLANLKASGKLTAKEVGEETRMDKVKVSRALTGLEERGWIKREPHPTDQRAQLVSLTAQGSRAVSNIIPRALEWEKNLLKSLTENEQRLMLKIIDKLNARLDDLSAEP